MDERCVCSGLKGSGLIPHVLVRNTRITDGLDKLECRFIISVVSDTMSLSLKATSFSSNFSFLTLGKLSGLHWQLSDIRNYPI